MFIIKPIDKLLAIDLIFKNHYSKIMPRLTKHYLGVYFNDMLVGVITLGWGVQPLNTIKKIFPSLKTKDYFEIGKMCMLEEMPKNSESQLLSSVIKWLRRNSDVKILYTWADGILGKPGYVYQSANFLYGGFIWTDLYISDSGEKVHPRTSQGLNEKRGAKVGRRPTISFLKENGWKHYRGKQFRYAYFLCDKKEKRRLLKESLEEWSINYPKHEDLQWKIKNLDTLEWEDVGGIDYNLNTSNDNNKTVKQNYKKVKQLDECRKFFNF